MHVNYADIVQVHNTNPAENAHVSHSTGHSIVPEAIQKAVPEGLERALPDAIHDTNSERPQHSLSPAQTLTFFPDTYNK